MIKAFHFVIGVDGGGTSTVARLADLKGNVLSEYKGGPSNLQTAGPDACAATLHSVVTNVCKNFRINSSRVGMVVYGTAGAGRKPDREAFYAAIRKKWKKLAYKPAGIRIVGDADIALEAAFGGEPGIIIIAGTGSIVYGRDVDGSIKRSGGWGPLLGDPGSGAALGMRALRSLAGFLDGCNKSSRLYSLMESEFGINSAESLISRVYKEKLHPSKLAPAVFEAAAAGDKTARSLIDENARELVGMLGCGVKKFGFRKTIPVAYVGGLFQSDSGYASIVTKHIKSSLPRVKVLRPKYKPEEGAVAMALRLLHEFDKTQSLSSL